MIIIVIYYLARLNNKFIFKLNMSKISVYILYHIKFDEERAKFKNLLPSYAWRKMELNNEELMFKILASYSYIKYPTSSYAWVELTSW